MMCYAGVSGGAMFVPEDIERRCNSRKYQDMLLAIAVPPQPVFTPTRRIKSPALADILEAA